MKKYETLGLNRLTELRNKNIRARTKAQAVLVKATVAVEKLETEWQELTEAFEERRKAVARFKRSMDRLRTARKKGDVPGMISALLQSFGHDYYRDKRGKCYRWKTSKLTAGTIAAIAETVSPYRIDVKHHPRQRLNHTKLDDSRGLTCIYLRHDQF